MNILFLDTETTGLDPEQNSVIQIAAEYHENGQLVKSFNKKCFGAARERAINLGALRVNKTKLGAFDSLESEYILVQQFVDFLLDLNSKEQLIVCGENINFDLSFIKQTLKRHRIEGLDALISYRVLDTGTISVFLKEAGVLKVDKVGLERVAKFLGLVEEGASQFHDAAYDTKLAARVFYKLLEMVKDLDIVVNSR